MNARDHSTGDAQPEVPVCAFRCLADLLAAPGSGSDAFAFDGPDLEPAAVPAPAGIILPTQGAGRAAALLSSGARCVLLGDSALRDPSMVAALAGQFGKDRVGVFAPSRRIAVQWSFDTVSNADFNVLTPSLGAPAWEVLLSDGSGTGTHTLWWIEQMLAQGAAQALLRVDIRDDADLNLCADCVERFGDRVWIGPLADESPEIDEWIAFGQARQLALPPALLARYSPVPLSPGTRAKGVTA